MVTKDEIKYWIESNLRGSTAEVSGDDGAHFHARVVYDGFSGISMIKQHRMVYNALGDKMQSIIHALSLTTKVKDD